MDLSRFFWFGALISSCFFLLIVADGQITDPEEVAALRAIKKSLVDPYQNLRNWKHGDPCIANWDGVLCLNMSTDDGYLHIKELQLLNMNLSGSLSPALGNLHYLKILDFMWNEISGSIPKEIGSITTLELLLLNGNKLTGSLPEEIGYLPNLVRVQLDQNQISGPIPESFANLNKTKHLHMNNNSISGKIPPELSTLSSLTHLLLDNNNLSGYLPPDLAKLPNLLILQLDNNHFDGGIIPSSYGSMPHLLKLSLRNCSLQGSIPNLSNIPNLAYIDLSSNQLSGLIPPDKLSGSITTIDLSNNKLYGTIPTNFSGLPQLQNLVLANNGLNGSVPSLIWQNKSLNGTDRLVIDLQNNMLSDISGSDIVPPNITVRLQGNPICTGANLVQFCGSVNLEDSNVQNSTNSTIICPVQGCPPPFEYAPGSPTPCFCAAPLLVGYRLKSPLISYFPPYMYAFEDYLTTGLSLKIYQLDIDSYIWEGHRLWMNLKIFPVYTNNHSYVFNNSEVLRIQSVFTEWKINDSDVFGPNELLNFTLRSPYKDVLPSSSKSGINKGALAGIITGAIVVAFILSTILFLLILRMRLRKYRPAPKRRILSKVSIIIDGLKSFTYDEMALATNSFDASTQVGQGGYGKVYKGTLADGTVVAIKRAEQGSLQGEREFLNEIELLSRLHHRNLVALIGYCDDKDEQMLIYEFMPNGTLRDHLYDKSKGPLSFYMRLRIAISSAKGILYLHTEADPPIFHRDIKASNILLDSRFSAKVADFGLSRLAPVPDTQGTVPDHVSTVVRGTPGYLDPEYFLTHKLTDKSDVYSLGVVLLELLTGKPPLFHGKNIVREMSTAYQSGMIFSSLDGRMGSYPSECIEKFVSLGLKCCRVETDARPPMAEVVRELESIWRMMPDSDTRSSDSFVTELQKNAKASSSSCMQKSAYVSSAGADVSSIIPR